MRHGAVVRRLGEGPASVGDHPDGTDYQVTARHGDPAHRDSHERLGFYDGWPPRPPRSVRHVRHDATPSGLLLLEYEAAGSAPVGDYAGVSDLV